MPGQHVDELAENWQNLLKAVPSAVCEVVEELTLEKQDHLAGFFYTHMLKSEAARVFLTHEQVQQRLHSSLRRWLVQLFAAYQQEDFRDLVLLQIQVGEVHARIDIPVYLVLRGARFLKQAYGELLRERIEDERVCTESMRYVARFIDMSMEVMSHAFGQSKDRQSRAEESYRLFAVVQNAAAERGRQRAALLDWENLFIFDVAVRVSEVHMPRIRTSEFGLWFRHKGAVAFQGTEETEQIQMAMRRIDEVLIPAIEQTYQEQAAAIPLLRELRDQTRSISLHLNNLFDQHNELEAGRDVLTRLLSRKYLPVVLGKEISYARRRSTGFALVGMDIDYFKDINDSYGHEAGDLVLQQMAELLTSATRSGDYVFRLGGEEFLIILVDTDRAGALRATNKLRAQLLAESFRLPGGRKVSISASFGVVMFDGHPDYQRSLRRVDKLLYQAKTKGRNRIEIEDEDYLDPSA